MRPAHRLGSLAVAALVGLWAATAPAPAQQPPPEGDRLTRLQGTASIDRRHDVVGALVRVSADDDPSKVWLTSTDEEGDFFLDDLREGSYTVVLERQGFAPVVKKNVSLRFPFRAVVEVTMQRVDEILPVSRGGDPAPQGTVRVEGTAHDRAGDPLSEVRVRFVHPEGRLDPRAVQTDAEGSFRFDDLPAGVWRLEVAGVGFLPMGGDLTLAVDTDLVLVPVRQPADYVPSPRELMPPERPTPPPGFEPKRVRTD